MVMFFSFQSMKIITSKYKVQALIFFINRYFISKINSNSIVIIKSAVIVIMVNIVAATIILFSMKFIPNFRILLGLVCGMRFIQWELLKKG